MSVVPDTAAAISEALAIESTTESASAVKRAVAHSIRAVDPAVSIETTEYFNHSFAPDLVLKWEKAPRRDERFVFLRFNEEPEWITEELPRLADRHPLVYGLSPTREDPDVEVLAERSRETETLVTDPRGVDQLGSGSSAGIDSFVSRTIVRGGRGLVDKPRAEHATREIVAGFQGALAADEGRTRSAVDTAEDYLRPGESAQVLRFLQAMWVSAGAAPERFPAEVGVAADPGNEALRFLIEQEDEIADDDFWRALGSSVTVERLSELGISGSFRNLQHLVKANLDRLWGRAVRVRPDQPRLDDKEETLTWRIELNLLALTGSDFTAYVGASVEDIAQVKLGDRGPRGVSVEELRARSRAVAVDSLELSNGERTVTYSASDQETDVAKDDELTAVATALGTTVVQRATITVGARHLDLDFTTSTASARTSAKPPLTDILGVGLPLLWPLSTRDREAFTSMMAAARERETMDLFSLLPEPEE
jgi:hypothetical protein